MSVAVMNEEILRLGDNETILSIFVACGLDNTLGKNLPLHLRQADV